MYTCVYIYIYGERDVLHEGRGRHGLPPAARDLRLRVQGHSGVYIYIYIYIYICICNICTHVYIYICI